MHFTIKSAGEGLCKSCRNAHQSVDELGKVITICESTSPNHRIYVAIKECNNFRPVGQMSEWEAKEVAWILEVKPGGKVGFHAPKKD